MVRTESRYIASDGTEFKDKREAILHDLAILDEREIDIFLSQSEYTVKRVTEYRKLLYTWQKYVRSQALEAQNHEQEESMNPL